MWGAFSHGVLVLVWVLITVIVSAHIAPGHVLLGVPSIPILQLTLKLPGAVHNLCVPPNQKQSSE